MTDRQKTIRQAMILSAGKGTRMRPLTLETPKPLIDVSGQPLIVWHIKALKSAGITEITINCSWLADKLIDTLGDGSQFGVNLHWSKENGEPLETAGGIAKALHDNKLKDENFLLINGDIWTTFDFSELINTNLSESLAHLLLIDNPDHNPEGDFLLQNGFASPKSGSSNSASSDTYTFSGISLINPKLLEGIKPNETQALAPLLIKAMQRKKVSAQHITSKWIDVGTPKRLEEVNKLAAQLQV